MTWQASIQRGREAFAAFRTRFPARRLARWGLVATALGTAAIVVEAVVRARLGTPEGRLPTTLYTRAVAWRQGSDERAPIAIGTLDGSAMESRRPVALTDVPDVLTQAVLAIEDQRFLDHHGLDLRRIGGALIANVRAGGIAQGGSTLTQQLAKNLFLSADRTPIRKLREAAIALVLEMRYDKTRILEAYLNEIYLGQDGGRAIHGVGAAARYYFGKDVDDLTLSESALLAGMISSPNRTAPTRHPDIARTRRDLVLQLMREQSRITRASEERAQRARVSTRAYSASTIDSRYFRDFVSGSLTERFPSRGVAVYTTLDAELQRAAERSVRRGLDRLQARGAEAALVALDPRNGDILAMVGGRDYAASQFNRAAGARRQPGSAFKPVVAAAALARGRDNAPAFTLASMVDDAPLRVQTSAGVWEPSNYDRTFRGRVTFREAMEHSLNVPFARIGLAIGPERVVATARRLGITSDLQAVPSLALGSSEVSLLELTRAYGVLAANGRLAPTRTMLGRARHGQELPDIDEDAVSSPQVLDPAVAFLVTSALEGVVAHGTGRALADAGFEGLAGKTGTSNDWRDAWFVAYSPTLVVGVWVGFDDGHSLRMTGATAALPIAASFLEQATPDQGWDRFEAPEGVTEGYAATGDGWGDCGEREYFLEGTEPGEVECRGVDEPDWRDFRDLGERMQRRAQRFLEEFVERQRDRRRWGRE